MFIKYLEKIVTDLTETYEEIIMKISTNIEMI